MLTGRNNKKLSKQASIMYHNFLLLVVGFRNSSYLLGKFVYSILVGVFGALLLVLFLSTLMDVFLAVKFVPWIIAFNTTITGYSLLDKTRDRLKHKQTSSVGAGILNVIITYIVLTLIFDYLLGEYLFSGWGLVFFLIIGIGCSKLGAMLAIKYFKLKK